MRLTEKAVERPLEDQLGLLQRNLGPESKSGIGEAFTRLRDKRLGSQNLMSSLLNGTLEGRHEFSEDFDVVSEFIARLQNAGYSSAAREVVNALLDERYVMWSEDPPVSEAREVTVVRFDVPDGWCADFIATHASEEAISILLHNKVMNMVFRGCGPAPTQLILGYDRETVLTWFPAEVHEKIGVWQARSHVGDLSFGKPVIGFHPECEHALWKKLYGSRASDQLANGMGVVISPRKEYFELKIET